MSAVQPSWTAAGKLVLITGATGGIGLATAIDLARRGSRVLVVGRTTMVAAKAASTVRAAAPGAWVEPLHADLSSMRQVRELAETVRDRHPSLDVLVNNAAVVSFARRTTEDGLELGFAVNHLAPFLVTTLLLPALQAGGAPLVVTVTSGNHRMIKKVDWADLQAERAFSGVTAYDRTKLMNIWFTRQLTARYGDQGLAAVCVAPGFVRTGLSRNATGFAKVFFTLARPFQTTPEKAAKTVADLVATRPASGYFAGGKATEASALARDDDQGARLWEVSRQLCDLPAAP